MLRKLCQVATIALVGLPILPATAGQNSDEAFPTTALAVVEAPASETIHRTTASGVAGKTDQLAMAASGTKEQDASLMAPSSPISIKYPALALLAVAIISMAALSRRADLTIDDHNG